MKTKTLIVVCLLICLSGCGKNGIGPIFIPNLSNLWTSSRGTTYSFFPAKTGVNESTFTGTEENGVISNFTGKFKNEDIEFTFSNGAEAGVRYSGKFIKDSNPLTMNVTGSNGVSLRLVRN